MEVHDTDGSQTFIRVRVQIDGEDFVVRGQASDDYVKQLARYVDVRVEQVRDSHPNLPRHRAAILAALHLADEIFRLKKENEELLELLEEAK